MPRISLGSKASKGLGKSSSKVTKDWGNELKEAVMTEAKEQVMAGANQFVNDARRIANPNQGGANQFVQDARRIANPNQGGANQFVQEARRIANPEQTSIQTDQQIMQAQEEERQRREEISQEISARIAELESKRDSEIQKLESERAQKVAALPSGPHGVTGFIISWPVVILYELLDAGINVIPIIGDAGSFMIGLIFFSMAALFLPSIFALMLIIIVLFVDFFIGSVTDLIPVIGTLGGTAVDLVFAAGAISHLIIMKTYKSSLPGRQRRLEQRYSDLIDHVRERFNEEKTNVKNDGHAKLSNIRVSPFHKFRSLFSGSSGDTSRNSLFMFLSAMFIFLGPFGFGFLNIETKGGIMIIFLALFGIALLTVFGMVSVRQTFGSVMVLGISLSSKYILFGLQSTNAFIIGGIPGSLIMFFGIILLVLIALWCQGIISSNVFPMYLFIIALVLSTPFLWGYFASGRASEDAKDNVWDLKNDLSNMNSIQAWQNWFTRSFMEGEGTIIADGEVEFSQEYGGVTILNAEPTSDSYLEGQQVVIRVDVEPAKLLDRQVPVAISCATDNGRYIAKNDIDGPIEFNGNSVEQIRCIFDNLPKGNNLVDVQAYYPFESSVEIPLIFADDAYVSFLEESGEDPNALLGVKETPKLITTSGPIILSVANTFQKDKNGRILELPIRANPEELDFPGSLTFQIAQQDAGEVDHIEYVEITTPKGIALTSCDFDPTNKNIPFESDNLGSRSYMLTNLPSLKQTINQFSCDFAFTETPQSMGLDRRSVIQKTLSAKVNYYYKSEHTTRVKIT